MSFTFCRDPGVPPDPSVVVAELRPPLSGQWQMCRTAAGVVCAGQSPELQIWHVERDPTGKIEAVIVVNGFLRLADRPFTDQEDLAQALLEHFERLGVKLLEAVEGSFSLCLFSAKRDQVLVATDLLATRPLWYFDDGDALIVSADPVNVAHLCPADSKPDPAFVWSTFHGRQPVGDRSLYDRISCLPAGCALLLDGASGRHRQERYFTPAYRPDTSRSLTDFGSEFLSIIGEVAGSISEDAEYPLLLLSGGLDSRLLASALDSRWRAATVLDAENPESRLSASIARKAGLEHRLVFRDADWYPRIFADYGDRWGGHFAWQEAHFWPLRTQELDFDVIAAGTLGDTLFKQVWAKDVVEFDPSFLEQPISNLVDWIEAQFFPRPIPGILQPAFAARAREAFRAELARVAAEYRNWAHEPADLVESLMGAGAGHRYRDYPNVLSVRDFASERSIYGHSRFRRFALELPGTCKRRGALITQAVRMTNMKHLLNANTWLPPSAPIWLHDMVARIRPHAGAVRRAILSHRKTPQVSRTSCWPEHSLIYATNKIFRACFEALLDEDAAWPEEIVDRQAVRSIWLAHLRDRNRTDEIRAVSNLGLQMLIASGQRDRWADFVRASSNLA